MKDKQLNQNYPDGTLEFLGKITKDIRGDISPYIYNAIKYLIEYNDKYPTKEGRLLYLNKAIHSIEIITKMIKNEKIEWDYNDDEGNYSFYEPLNIEEKIRIYCYSEEDGDSTDEYRYIWAKPNGSCEEEYFNTLEEAKQYAQEQYNQHIKQLKCEK
jgi:hypothetical protein